MQADPIETILARLMPPALSQNCQEEIEAMIGELAGPEPEKVVEISSGRWLVRCLIGGGIAAAIGAVFAIFPVMQESRDSRVAMSLPQESTSGFVLVSESDRIESMIDEGWREGADGSAMHAMRLSAVEENSVLDEESGMVVKISEPREEILLMPVSAF
jgi:hypothetical protein